MSYPEILSMLDAEIARLEKAREILLSFAVAVPRKSPRPRTNTPKPALVAPVQERPVENQVQVQKLQPRRSYAARVTRSRTVPEPESALRSAVPEGPVVVPASAVRQLASLKTTAAAAAPVVAAPAWRAEVEHARRTDDLLQRFMEMGSGSPSVEDAERAVTTTRP